MDPEVAKLIWMDAPPDGSLEEDGGINGGSSRTERTQESCTRDPDSTARAAWRMLYRKRPNRTGNRKPETGSKRNQILGRPATHKEIMKNEMFFKVKTLVKTTMKKHSGVSENCQ